MHKKHLIITFLLLAAKVKHNFTRENEIKNLDKFTEKFYMKIVL